MFVFSIFFYNFDVRCKKTFLVWSYKDVLVCFLLKLSGFSCLYIVLWYILGEYILCKLKVQFHLFTCDHSLNSQFFLSGICLGFCCFSSFSECPRVGLRSLQFSSHCLLSNFKDKVMNKQRDGLTVESPKVSQR